MSYYHQLQYLDDLYHVHRWKAWCQSLPSIRCLVIGSISYLTIWTGILGMVFCAVPSTEWRARCHRSLALQSAVGGFYLTHVYPRVLTVPFCKMIIRPPMLWFTDFFSHHIPLLLAYHKHPEYSWQSPQSLSEWVCFHLPLLFFFLFMSPSQKYHVSASQLIQMLSIYFSIQLYFACPLSL